MKLNNPTELLYDQLRELQGMEVEIARTFSVLSGSVSNISLRSLLWQRALSARERRDKLSNLRPIHGVASKIRICYSIKGILAEGSKCLESTGNLYTKDLVMIGQFMRIEHAAIIAYRIVSRLADRAGFAVEADQMMGVLSELEIARTPLQSLEGDLFRTATLHRAPGNHLTSRPARPRKKQTTKLSSILTVT
jgi:ferritin-like metal-binding protein YciE